MYSENSFPRNGPAWYLVLGYYVILSIRVHIKILHIWYNDNLTLWQCWGKCKRAHGKRGREREREKRCTRLVVVSDSSLSAMSVFHPQWGLRIQEGNKNEERRISFSCVCVAQVGCIFCVEDKIGNSSLVRGCAPYMKIWIGKPEPDTGSVSKKIRKKYLNYKQKVSFA